MAKSMEALGAVVAGACQEQVPGTCLYPDNAVGALLVFNDDTRRQFNVCKACADYLFATGEWYRTGEEPPEDESDSEGFRRYIWEIKQKTTHPEQLEVALRYQAKTWVLRVPLSAGIDTSDYWVVDVNLGSLGWVKVAFPKDDKTTPAIVKVRPVTTSEEQRATGGALLATTERLT